MEKVEVNISLQVDVYTLEGKSELITLLEAGKESHAEQGGVDNG